MDIFWKPTTSKDVNQDNSKRGFKVNWKNPLIMAQILLLILLVKSAHRLQEWMKRGLKNTETHLLHRQLYRRSAFHACQLLQLHVVERIHMISRASLYPYLLFPNGLLLQYYEVTIKLQKLPLISYLWGQVSGCRKCLPRLWFTSQRQKIQNRKGKSAHSGEHQSLEHRASPLSPFLIILSERISVWGRGDN